MSRMYGGGLRSLTEPSTPRSQNFGDLFWESLRLRPNAAALLEGDRTLTYAELDERVRRVATLLTERGAGTGTRVTLLFNNQIEVVELTFGAMRAGAVPVHLNPKLPTEQLTRIVAHSDARILVAGRDQVERAVDVLNGISEPVRLLVDAEDPVSGESYSHGLANSAPQFETVAVQPDDVCMQPYTSGSTGEPKGVLLTHGGAYWCVNMLRRVLLIEPTERALVAVPLCHKNAMLGAVKPFLMAGGSVVVLPSFEAAAALRAIERYKVTYITGVPALYKLMLKSLSEGRYDLSSLEWGVVGSASVPEDLLHQVERGLGIRLVESYGITEGGPEVALTPRWGLQRMGWTGIPVPGVEVRVVDPEDYEMPLPEDEIGELLVRSPGVAKGYYKDPERSRERFLEGGWLRTGDLACLDADHYLKIVGRVDDMINAGGEHVFPQRVEELLRSHPAVFDACVVRQSHEIKGEVPVAFVVLRVGVGRAPDVEELKSWCLARGPAFAHPRHVYVRSALPLGGTGKTDRRSLEREAAALAHSAKPIPDRET